jgi:DNA-binding transcriptional LysR family regulator
MQISFIAAGIGVGFVNSSIANLLADDVVIRPVDEITVSLRLDMVWSRGSRSSSLPHFVDVVRREIGKT